VIEAFQMSPGRHTLREVEDAYIEYVVRGLGGNRAAAARSLGISASTVRRRLTLMEEARAKRVPGQASAGRDLPNQAYFPFGGVPDDSGPT
jgi:hypothetical protein